MSPSLYNFLILLPFFSFSLAFQSNRPKRTTLTNQGLWMSSNEDDDGVKKKSTMFDRVIDDFINKRYGAGEAFYGKRTSRLTEEEYKATRPQRKRYDKNEAMRNNAILIVGNMRSFGQWVAFELNELGFNVRVAPSTLKAATDVFGTPGYNVDMIELNGDLTPEEDYAIAINGVQAIVVCVNFIPLEWSGNSKDDCIDQAKTAINIIDIATKARQAKVGKVKKVVLVSRYLPDYLVSSRDPWSGKLLYSSDSDMYEEYRKVHEDVEKHLRASGLDFVIIRVPPVVWTQRNPASLPLTLVSARQNIKITRPQGNPLLNAILEQPQSAQIGVLDLAEVTTQSLLQDVSGMTFSIFETNTVEVVQAPDRLTNVIAGQKELEGGRVPRPAYYSALLLDDAALKTSYIIKSPEEYSAQLIEDAQLEKYWLQRLTLLEKDRDETELE